jgi:hypothetical protein
VWISWDEILAYEIGLLTSIDNASEIYAEFLLRNDSARMLVPQILSFGNSKI